MAKTAEPNLYSEVRSYRHSAEGPEPFVEYEACALTKIRSGRGGVFNEEVTKWTVWHRYSDFKKLDTALRATYGWQMDHIKFPPSKLFGANSPAFLEKRRLDLNNWIQAVLKISGVTEFDKHFGSKDLKEFFDYDRIVAERTAAAQAQAAAAAVAPASAPVAVPAPNAGAAASGAVGTGPGTSAVTTRKGSRRFTRHGSTTSRTAGSGSAAAPSPRTSMPDLSSSVDASTSPDAYSPPMTAAAPAPAPAAAAPAPAPAPVAAAPAPAPAAASGPTPPLPRPNPAMAALFADIKRNRVD